MELGRTLLPGMCAATLFHPPHTFISLGEHLRSEASCLPDIVDLSLGQASLELIAGVFAYKTKKKTLLHNCLTLLKLTLTIVLPANASYSGENAQKQAGKLPDP